MRLYHYTNAGTAALRSIERHGILRTHAQGNRYGEPAVVWASTERPRPFKEYVEFWARPAEIDIGSGGFRDVRHPTAEEIADLEQRRSNVTLWGDVPAAQIVAVHEPWHHTYRYLEENAAAVDSLNEWPALRHTGDVSVDEGIRRWFAAHPSRDRPTPGRERRRPLLDPLRRDRAARRAGY